MHLGYFCKKICQQELANLANFQVRVGLDNFSLGPLGDNVNRNVSNMALYITVKLLSAASNVLLQKLPIAGLNLGSEWLPLWQLPMRLQPLHLFTIDSTSKCLPKFSKSCPKSNHMSFYLKLVFQNRQPKKSPKIWATFARKFVNKNF